MLSSVVRAMKVLEALAATGKPAALKDLATMLGLDKATAHRLLNSLCSGGMVQKVGGNGCYALGPACLKLAESFRKSLPMRDRVLPYLDKLVKWTGETAIYCERYSHDSCVTVERRDSPHDTRTFSGTGVVRPLTAGSSAQAILAMLPREEMRSIVDGKKLLRRTPFAPATKQEIFEKVRRIEARGYAVSIRERDLDTGGIAAPIFNDRAVIGSIAIIGPIDRIKRFGIEKLGAKVRLVAGEFSRELGGSEGRLGRKLSLP
jgi:DNA-binding IclR family transcriptional regulator